MCDKDQEIKILAQALAEAQSLLREADFYIVRNAKLRNAIDAALSASAESSAPVEVDERADVVDGIPSSWEPYTEAEPDGGSRFDFLNSDDPKVLGELLDIFKESLAGAPSEALDLVQFVINDFSSKGIDMSDCQKIIDDISPSELDELEVLKKTLGLIGADLIELAGFSKEKVIDYLMQKQEEARAALARKP